MFRWIKQKYYGLPTDRERADSLNAAIQYACSHYVDDAIEWLRAWNEGDPDAMEEIRLHQLRH